MREEEKNEQVVRKMLLKVVRHAHWIKVTPHGKAHSCSECNSVFQLDKYELLRYRYCPICGAKMDEKMDEMSCMFRGEK